MKWLVNVQFWVCVYVSDVCRCREWCYGTGTEYTILHNVTTHIHIVSPSITKHPCYISDTANSPGHLVTRHRSLVRPHFCHDIWKLEGHWEWSDRDFCDGWWLSYTLVSGGQWNMQAGMVSCTTALHCTGVQVLSWHVIMVSGSIWSLLTIMELHLSSQIIFNRNLKCWKPTFISHFIHEEQVLTLLTKLSAKNLRLGFLMLIEQTEGTHIIRGSN